MKTCYVSYKGILITVLIVFVAIVNTFVLNAINYECPIFHYLNIYCAGCGATRMVIALLQGNIYQAFRYNPLMFILLILGIIYGIWMIIYYIKNKMILVPTLKIWLIIIGVMIVYMVLRNIPSFVYLIPTEI